jgi:hypothetical protein
LPAWRWTGATCRGRPRRRLHAPLKCHHRGDRRRPQTTARDKKVHSSSRQAARPAREDQGTVRPRVAPNKTGASKLQRATPHQADPPRRSEERPAPVHQLFNGSDRPDSDSLQRCRSWGKSTDSASTSSTPQVVDSGTASRRLQSWQSPGCSRFPRRRQGPRTNPGRRRGRRISPRADEGAHCRR